MFAADAPAETEDLRRRRIRIELDVVARSVPDVPRPAEELMRLVAAISVDAQRLERQRDHADLLVMWIDVDDGQDHVCKVVGALGVGDDLVVLGGVEHQAVVAVQRRVLTPNLVEHRDQLAKAARAVAVPAANLVLLVAADLTATTMPC